MTKIFRSQTGQLVVTEMIILISVIIIIAAITVGALSNSVREVDQKYQTEVRQFFLQGE